MRHLPARVLLAIAALCTLFAIPASAVQSSVDLLLDLDNDAATGCTVTTPAGPFAGVEQILRTTVDTVGTSTANVTEVSRLDCSDPGTDTFTGPLPVDPGDWPVGVGLGLDGFNVVETYFPLSATSIAPRVVRIGVVHSRDPDFATLLVATPSTTDPILLDLRAVLEIPTLGQWGLILLAALLAAASLYVLGRRGVAVLVLMLVMGTAGLAWAQCVLDGDPGDWSAADLLGADPAAADDGISVRAIFGRAEAGQLCFRIDLSLQFDQPPTISAIADQSTPEDTSTGALAFTVGDLEDAPGSLMVTATSSNQILVPNANLVLGGAGANRTIDITPAANQNGMTVVTLAVQDSAGNTTQTSFMVTVTSVNDPPTISAIGDQVILEDSGTGPLAFTVGDTETAATSLVTSATSSNTTIIPNANLVIVGSGANRTITVTPAADQNGGPVTIDVVVQDTDGGSTPESFTVTVTPVNDAPSFTLAGNVMSDEDAGAQNVPNQATAISAGPANEAGQAVTFSVTNDNNPLFSAQPAIDASGTLTYTSAPNANGSATVTVQAMDNGGTANGGVDTSAAQMFTITVNAVNDPPMVVGEIFDVAAGNFDPAIGNTTLQFAASDTVTHPHVYVAGNVLANDSDTDGPSALSITTYDAASAMGGTVSMTLATGEFTYEPPLGYEGSDSFTYTVTDGVTSAVGTVTIEVSGMVWYLDNQTDGTGDDGRSGSPFDTITQLEAVNGGGGAADPEAGDIIFVHTGAATYDAGAGNLTGLSLLSGQKLWGEGFGLTVLGKTLVPAGTRPSIDNTNTGGDGVTVLANAGNGDRSGVEIRGLTVSGDDNAIDVSAADANNLDVALSDNVLSSTGGASLLVDGSGSTGTTVLTELGGTGVTTSGSAGGEHFESVTFDADPVTAGIQPVTAGNVTVGNPASPGDVGGGGVVLSNVRGNLQFGTLNVGNTGGPGLYVRDADGKMGTFALAATGGTVHTVNGSAVDIDPVALSMTLGSVVVEATAGAVPYGINLDTVAGTFQVTGTTSISATTGTIGTGIAANNASASVTFGGATTVSTTTGPGISVVGGTGPFTVSSTMSSISGAAGSALFVDQGMGNVTYNGSITNSAGRSVEITNHDGPAGGSTITVAGAVTDTGSGIYLSTNAGGAGGTVIDFTGPLSLTTGANDAFTASLSGTINVTDPMNNNLISTTTGSGVTISDTAIGGSGVKLTTVNVGDSNAAAPNASQGILLSSVGAGSFTATGGAIQNVTSHGLDVSGGSGNVTVGTSISTTTAGRSVQVIGHTGGTVAVSGAIDDNGLGVDLESNTGGTINLTGNMTIDTVGANTGFNATGGGTVNVMTGTNDVNTSAGTGVAVNINGTAIGPSGVTFHSVSADGAAYGIRLNGAGSGFTVTGTGTTDASGGTIQNISQRGVEILSTDGVSLSNITLDNTATTDGASNCDNLVNDGCNAAVHLNTVVGATLTNLDIDGSGQIGINGVGVDGLTIDGSTVFNAGDEVNEGCLQMFNLSGTSAITSSDFAFPSERAAFVRNTVAGNLGLTVSGSTFRDTQSSMLGADGLELDFFSTATGTIDVTNSSFLRNATKGIQVDSEDTSVVGIDVTSSTFDPGSGTGIGLDLDSADSAQLSFNVIGNPVIKGNGGTAVNVFAIGTSTIQGRINNNPDIQVGGSGTSGLGIKVDVNGDARGTVEISGNTISNIGFDAGIEAIARLKNSGACGTGCTAGRLDATISGNTVSVDSTSLYDVWVQASDDNTTCANVTNNTTSGSGIVAFRERTAAANSTVLLQGFTTDAATTWNNNGNTPTGSVSASNNGTLSGGSCSTPSNPMP